MLAPKHGRTYRRAAITKKASKNTRALGLRERVSNAGQLSPEGFSLEKRRAVVGYKIHRASAPGEAPAVDHSALINSIRTVPKGTRAVIYASHISEILEEKKDRPVFAPSIEKIRPGFLKSVAENVNRLCQ